MKKGAIHDSGAMPEDDNTRNDCQSDILALPTEIKLHLFKTLSALDVCHLGHTCLEFQGISNDDIIWKSLAAQKGIPLRWRQHIQETKRNKFKKYTQDYKFIHEKFPEKLSSILGDEIKLADLPILDIRVSTGVQNKDELTLPIKFKGNKIMLGLDELNNHFIAFCIKENEAISSDENAPFLPKVSILILSLRRLLPFDTEGMPYLKIIRPWHDYLTVTGHFQKYDDIRDYIGRLLRKEPCENVFTSDDLRNLPDGRSVIELTDQTEFDPTIKKMQLLTLS